MGPGKANDKRAGTSARHAWVIDGATDLGPAGLLRAETGAAWLSSFANTGFFSIGAPTSKRPATPFSPTSPTGLQPINGVRPKPFGSFPMPPLPPFS